MNDNRAARPDARRLLRVIRLRAPLVVLCAIIAGAVAFWVAKQQHKKWTATSSIVFQSQSLNEQAAGLQASVQSDPQAQTDTDLKLAALPTIASRTAAAVKNGYTRSSVQSAVSVSEVSDTDIADISATAPSPQLAARLANEYARQAINYRAEQTRQYYASALRAVNLQLSALPAAQQAGAQGADLRDRAASLQILGKLQDSQVQLAQAAIAPSTPSSPKVKEDLVLGVLLGAIVGIAISVALFRLDTKLRDPDELADAYGIPILGVIPEARDLRLEGARDGTSRAEREAELFALLRVGVRYFNVDHEPRVVAVVSGSSGDGKSTIARNLAWAAATLGERVLYIEADLRRPVAARSFGLEDGAGVSGVLAEKRSLSEVVQTAQLEPDSDTGLFVDVLTAGRALPGNPVRVLASDAMDELVKDAREQYDFVVIDTAPLSVVADAFPLLREVDGVLVVSRVGRDTRDRAHKLREALENADAPVIGIVANGARRVRGQGYGYEYAQAGT